MYAYIYQVRTDINLHPGKTSPTDTGMLTTGKYTGGSAGRRGERGKIETRG